MSQLYLNNGDHLPRFGLGTWKAQADIVYNAVFHALKSGYRHIDCAPIYMNEKPVGRAIKEAISKNIVARDQLWLTSKLWNSYHAPEDVIPALKETLHFMQCDHLDLFLIHWPVACKKSIGYSHAKTGSDYISLSDIPLTATWEAMEEAVNQGLVRHIGSSNFSISKLKDILSHATIKPVMNQVECHPYLNQNELIEFCQQQGIEVTAYSPLGSNDRPKRDDQAELPALLDNEIINHIANKHQKSPAQILLAWQLERGVIVIPKSSSPARIEENFAAQHLLLDSEDQQRINALDRNQRYIDGRFFEIKNGPYSAESLWR